MRRRLLHLSRRGVKSPNLNDSVGTRGNLVNEFETVWGGECAVRTNGRI